MQRVVLRHRDELWRWGFECIRGYEPRGVRSNHRMPHSNVRTFECSMILYKGLTMGFSLIEEMMKRSIGGDRVAFSCVCTICRRVFRD